MHNNKKLSKANEKESALCDFWCRFQHRFTSSNQVPYIHDITRQITEILV